MSACENHKARKDSLPWRVQLASSAFALSVIEPIGTSEGTQPSAIPTPGITTPVSTPLQPTGSPGGTKSVPTTEEFTHSTSSWTPVVSQGPSTPSPSSTWTSGSYKVILAEHGVRKPRLKGSLFLWPSQSSWLGGRFKEKLSVSRFLRSYPVFRRGWVTRYSWFWN